MTTLAFSKGELAKSEVKAAAGGNKVKYASPALESFHRLVFNGKKDEVREALASGGQAEALANGSRSDGIRALHIAASLGRAGICSTLLKYGAKADAREHSHGATPLAVACQNGHQRVVAVLLGAGADVNAQRDDGATPIFVASQEGWR